MNLALGNLVNADRLEKVVLAKRVSRFLATTGHGEAEIDAASNIARALAQDLSIQVRETLSFELRLCRNIPHDLAARIVSDIDSVSGPFIEVTEALSDGQWAGLVPHLEEHAHLRLARRKDIGEQTAYALVANGSEQTAARVMANIEIRLTERVYDKTIDRFSSSELVLGEMSRRDDLALRIVERIIGLVSEDYKRILLSNYALPKEVVAEIVFKTQHETLWRQIAKAGPAQVHGYVVDLKREGRLSETLTLEMVERGSFQFLGSALAIEAGVTLGAVRAVLEQGDLREVLKLVYAAGFGRGGAQRICRVLKENQIAVRRSAVN
ncbi:DUF2336 domain-containing protein [Kordiimonas aestuarii]|uniref:DUF2336 domain-containing protein n=1 Tax=Kordiimonas aestuarii TaxID=1005925 RepID=UPI0021D0A0AB|nr:DUF2336 domain-containing protein [Kordiimonas aestuarii]